jgi:hypothetical protein
MMQLLVLLLIIWVALAVIGLVVKGLFWLFVIGAVLFVATSAWGWVKER